MAKSDVATRTLRQIAMRYAGAEETIACKGPATVTTVDGKVPPSHLRRWIAENLGAIAAGKAPAKTRPTAAKKARGVRK